MKDIENLIKKIEKEIELIWADKEKHKEAGKKEDYIFCEGIIEGYNLAIQLIRKTDKTLTKKLLRLINEEE